MKINNSAQMDSLPANINLRRTLKVPQLLPLSMVVVGFLVLNAGTISDMVALWYTRPHSHGQGILILLISVYMLRRQWPHLRKIPVNSSMCWGALLLSVACILVIFGRLTLTITVQQFAFILTLMGLTLLVLGWRHLKALFLSISYLVFLFPIVGTVLSSRVILLQKATATIAAGLLGAIGFSVFKHGHLIQLPHIALDVVAACSGINHIVSLVAIAIPLAILSNLNPLGKVSLISAAAVIGIFANGFRVFLIGVWTHLFRGANVHGPEDALLISFDLLFGMVVLLLVWYLLPKKQKRNRSAETVDERETYNPTDLKIKSAAVLTALVLTFGFSSLNWFYKTRPVILQEGFDPFPALIDGWHGQAEEIIAPQLSAFGADRIWFIRYRSADELWAYAYMGYFEKQSEGREVFGITKFFDNNSQVAASDLTTTLIGFTFNSAPSNFDGFAAYLIGGRSYSVAATAKAANLRNTLLNRHNNAAVLILLLPKGTKIEKYSTLINALLAHNAGSIL
jgi:exosortase